MKETDLHSGPKNLKKTRPKNSWNKKKITWNWFISFHEFSILFTIYIHIMKDTNPNKQIILRLLRSWSVKATKYVFWPIKSTNKTLLIYFQFISDRPNNVRRTAIDSIKIKSMPRPCKNTLKQLNYARTTQPFMEIVLPAIWCCRNTIKPWMTPRPLWALIQTLLKAMLGLPNVALR